MRYTYNRWKYFNPTYDVHLFDDETCKQFLETHFGSLHREIFEFIKDGPIKSDFWRLCIVYELGGIYVDCDIELLTPLDKFIDPKSDIVTVISSNFIDTNSEWAFNPHLLAARPKDSDIKRCIDRYIDLYNNKHPYDYWQWSICRLFTIPHTSITKDTNILNINSKQYQFLHEQEFNHSTYENVRVLNNRYENYDGTRHEFINIEDTFTQIYKNNVWGNNEHSLYVGSSGGGSDLNYNRTYISFLKSFLQDSNIRSVVDVGCGDFRCGPHIYDEFKNISYIGFDVYKDLVNANNQEYGNENRRFEHLDVVTNIDKLPSADLCIIKDVLQHYQNGVIISILDGIISNKLYKYILLTNCSYQWDEKREFQMGDFRPLNKDMFPLNKYELTKMISYDTKDVLLYSCK